ncbi:MAG TPA: DUF1622 domain-containing protein [Stellaceae bacterium]
MIALIAPAILLIEFGGAVAIVGACLTAVVRLFRDCGDIDAARRIVAGGVVWGLDFKLAATLLKTTELRSWEQILVFAAVLTLRTVVKRVLAWEQGRLRRGGPPTA